MRASAKQIVRSAIKGAVVSAVCFVSVWWLHLGWFVPLVVIAGALAAVATTRREQGTSGRLSLIIVVTLVSYLLATAVLYIGLINQVSHRTFEMTWRDNGSVNRFGESEVVLEFAQFPGNSIGTYSTALRDHLLASGGNRTEVEFELVTDVWCVRGFHEVRIGDLTDLSKLKRSSGYSQRVSNAASPWGPRHWWCR